MSLKIYTTEEWTADKPKAKAKKSKAEYIVIHHTATKPSSGGTVDGGKKLAKSIQKYHMNKGWIDSGHNFLNTIGGHVFEGRHGTIDALKEGMSVQSAHAGNYQVNKSPGIENEGIYSSEEMPDKQWNSLVELCTELCMKLSVDPSKIKGHRTFKATKCPGNRLFKKLDLLRSEVRKKIAESSS